MSKVGRKSVYEDKIKSKFAEIKKLLEGGASEKQVAESLGIAYSTFNRYKAEKKEFAELLKSVDRTELIQDLKSALIKKALGFEHEEKKQYVKEDSITGKKYKYTEITTKYYPPDVAAINLALKNYDRDDWSNDWQAYDLKKQELELRKQMAEAKDW